MSKKTKDQLARERAATGWVALSERELAWMRRDWAGPETTAGGIKLPNWVEKTEEEAGEEAKKRSAGGIVLPVQERSKLAVFAGLSVWREKHGAQEDNPRVRVVVEDADRGGIAEAITDAGGRVYRFDSGTGKTPRDARVAFLRRCSSEEPFPGGLAALVRTLEGLPRTRPNKPSARSVERVRQGVVDALMKLGLERADDPDGRRFTPDDVLSAEWRELRSVAIAFWKPLTDEIVPGSDEKRKSLASHACLLLRSVLRYGLVLRLEALGIAEEVVSEDGALVPVTNLLVEREPEVYRRAAGAFGAAALELSEQGGECQPEARELGTLLQQISVGAPGGFEAPEGEPSTAHRSKEVKALIAALERMGLTSARVSARVEFHLEDLSDVRRGRRSRAAAAFRDELQQRRRAGDRLVLLLEILSAGGELPAGDVRGEATGQGPDLFEHVAKLLRGLDITSASDEAGHAHTLSDLTSADAGDRKAAVNAFCRLVDRGLSDRGQERITWRDQEARRKADDAEAPFRDVLSLLQGISLGARNLTEVDELWHGSSEGTGEGTGAIVEDAGIETELSPREAFATASAAEIVEALQPDVPDEAIARIQDLIQDAQKNPPEDKAGFVAEINAALDALNLRIRVAGGDQLARLKFLRASKSGSIQLGLPGTSRGFQGVDLEVVRVTAGSRKRAADHPVP